MAPLVYQRTILFGDTDAAGIVYTPRFSHYCMEAAEVWFRDVIDFDWYRINTELDLGSPVVHMAIDFLGPLIAADRLRIPVAVEKVGRSTIALGFSGFKNDNPQPVFKAQIVFCCVAKGQGAIAIPDRQRRLIEEYIAASQAEAAGV